MLLPAAPHPHPPPPAGPTCRGSWSARKEPMRLQESPPIQPKRNHRDSAWSMLPALQALMYWLQERKKTGAQGRAELQRGTGGVGGGTGGPLGAQPPCRQNPQEPPCALRGRSPGGFSANQGSLGHQIPLHSTPETPRGHLEFGVGTPHSLAYTGRQGFRRRWQWREPGPGLCCVPSGRGEAGPNHSPVPSKGSGEGRAVPPELMPRWAAGTPWLLSQRPSLQTSGRCQCEVTAQVTGLSRIPRPRCC